MIDEGKPAPMFTLPSDTGEDVSLESLRGKPVVLYLYSKDDTRSPFHSRNSGTRAA
jgi:peroxiredoxin Q/BCP